MPPWNPNAWLLEVAGLPATLTFLWLGVLWFQHRRFQKKLEEQ